MNLVSFYSWADWAVMVVLKIYPTFNVFFSYFHGQKNTKLEFLYIVGSKLKSKSNLKVRKLSI